MIISVNDYIKDSTFPIWIDSFKHNHNNAPPIHSHEFIELVYVVSGQAQHNFEGRVAKNIGAGDVFIIYPGEQHSFSVPYTQQLEIINCLFLPDIIHHTSVEEFGISEFFNIFEIQSLFINNKRLDPHLHLSNVDANQIYQTLLRMKNELDLKTSGSLTLIRLYLVEILVLLSRIVKNNNDKKITKRMQKKKDCERETLIAEIKNYLTNYYNEKVSTAKIASEFNISSRHLNRIFKQETGLTVMEMIHQIRVKKAMDYLQSSDEKVINVAIKVGYDDPAYFSRLFRRKVGCSPGDYKKNKGVLIHS